MLVTADIYDQFSDRVESGITQLKQYGCVQAFHGVIRTVSCVNDNVLIKKVLQQPSEGGVLVVDAGCYLGAAVMGDNIAKLAVAHGWSGVIINGAIRDAAIIKDIHLGVKAIGTNPKKTSKKGEGRVDVQVAFGNVAFGNVAFIPGHYIYSDEDGILVSDKQLKFRNRSLWVLW